MRRYLTVGALVALVSTSCLADHPERKKPWQWTLEERLALRLDPAHIKARALVHAADYPQAKAVRSSDERSNRKPVTAYGIDGRRNPELFLPHELFDTLLRVYGPDKQSAARRREDYGRALSALGFDEKDFWSRLEAVSSEYIALQNSPRSPGRDDEAHRIDRCRARYSALQSARNTFGGFDALLYMVVAPGQQYGVSADGDEMARLRAEAEGCQ